MSKLTKQQRRKKRKQKKLQDKKRRDRRLGERQVPWVAPKMRMFQLPAILPSEMPHEQRREIVRAIAEKAKSQFDSDFPKLEQWFRDYDAPYLLSFCAFYFVAYREGTDPEMEAEPFFHHYLEILQAFALTQPRSHKLRPLFEDSTKLHALMRDLGRVISLRWLDIPDESADDSEFRAYQLRTGMMVQTAAVRNWAHLHQMKRVVLDLCSKITQQFEAIHAVNPTQLFQMLFALVEERESLLNSHLAKVRDAFSKDNYAELLAAYNAAFPENEPIVGDEVEQIWEMADRDLGQLRGMLVRHADLKLEEVYSFAIDHALSLVTPRLPRESVERILEKLSYGFGDLREFEREHMVLGNPVLRRPFIALGEGEFFSAVWGVFPHIALDLLEVLVWEDVQLRDHYTSSKAQYLEDEVERMFSSAFPSGRVLRGSQWQDETTGRVFENDLTLLLDNFAIVVEAKSGIVTEPAKRGAPKRLFETLRELIEEPSEQAARFIQLLRENRRRHVFQTRRGAANVIDSNEIKYFVPLGVTFANLGMIGSNLKKLIDARVLNKRLDDLAPSISFTDLELIFELLPMEVEKIHYLVRRREFEAHVRYEGDEMDLLGFYLDNGFNIGEDEYQESTTLSLVLKSKELDPYFVGLGVGKAVPKPALALSAWWRAILNRVEERKGEGWVETGFILLNSTKEDQERFEREFKYLMGRVANGRMTKAHNWVVFTTGPARRRYLFAAFPYTTADREVRDAILSQILSEDDTRAMRGAIVLGVQLRWLDYPYTVLARRARTDLFDDLTA